MDNLIENVNGVFTKNECTADRHREEQKPRPESFCMRKWVFKATPLIGGAEESHLQQIILGFWTNHEHIKMQFHSVPPTATLAYFLKEDDWPKGKKSMGPLTFFPAPPIRGVALKSNQIMVAPPSPWLIWTKVLPTARRDIEVSNPKQSENERKLRKQR